MTMITIDKSFAPFMLTHAEYARLVDKYDHLFTYHNIIVTDQDSSNVMGYIRTESHDLPETHDYFVLQDITHAPIVGLQNAWFLPSGKILYVPWYAHNLTACVLGHMSGYADELESMGWFHYSMGCWRNRNTAKITDRMYDSLARYADQNNEDVAYIAYGKMQY